MIGVEDKANLLVDATIKICQQTTAPLFQHALLNPILLRVDLDAGHGLGLGRKQLLELVADEY